MEQNQNIRGWGVFKSVITVVIVLAITGIAMVSILRDRIVNQPQNQVTIIGQGKVAYQPDIANVTLGVQIDKVAKADDALNQLNDKINKIIAAIKVLGVDPADIQTENLSLSPQYDYNNSVSALSGYSANQQLIVKIKNIKDDQTQLSKIIAEASKAGANQILGIAFDVSNLEDLKQQARIGAIADAQGKASRLAEAAHVRLGDIVGWWENVVQAPGGNNPLYSGDKGGVGGGAGAGNVSTPTIPNGSQEVIVEMNLSYKLK